MAQFHETKSADSPSGRLGVQVRVRTVEALPDSALVHLLRDVDVRVGHGDLHDVAVGEGDLDARLRVPQARATLLQVGLVVRRVVILERKARF